MFLVFPRIRLRISVFALPALLVMLWLEGLLPFVMLVLSAVIHEIGHILAIRRLGYRARRVDVLPMGALIVCPESITYRDETVIALSGPISSAVASFAAFCIYSLTFDEYIFFFAFINLTLAVFNLLPIKSLDGGKALNCFLLYKGKENCERICSAASVFAKVTLVILMLAGVVSSGYNLGVILLSSALLFQL
jgi:stage IV sporulation protein FB